MDWQTACRQSSVKRAYRNSEVNGKIYRYIAKLEGVPGGVTIQENNNYKYIPLYEEELDKFNDWISEEIKK